MATPSPERTHRLPLTLVALGVVFGDIGTSPLYAVREVFQPAHDLAVTQASIMGVLSLIFWSLIVVISLKYAVFVLRADRDGEGGILVLTSLVTPLRERLGGTRRLLVLLGLFGTALLFGDAMITPAISVLSAVEGVGIVAPHLDRFVMPVAIVVLVALFSAQRRGTGAVGSVFGPVMLLWFVTIAALGVHGIVREPAVLSAIDPRHAISFFAAAPGRALIVLGSVVLAVTGGEALYADIGHVGKRAVRLGWFLVALPALLLNYAGQAALLLGNPAAVGNPFFLLAPASAQAPLVALATLAAVIASQALITGVFSLAMQAVRLGYLPRLRVDHTSASAFGQVYVPAVNWLLLTACTILVVGFRTSSNLAAAYGVAVTATMVITSLLLLVVARETWRWPLLSVVLVGGTFLLVDATFLTANLAKIAHGGWVPLVVAVAAFIVMTTWRSGRRELRARLGKRELSIERFLNNLRSAHPQRVPGTAVIMHGRTGVVPPVLLANLRHNHVIHNTVVMLSVETAEEPYVLRAGRLTVKEYGDGFFHVLMRFGFMERANVPLALTSLVHPALSIDPTETTYFLGREIIVPDERLARVRWPAGHEPSGEERNGAGGVGGGGKSGGASASPSKHPHLRLWRRRLFALMSRNATNAATYFALPVDRVVEVGVQIEL